MENVMNQTWQKTALSWEYHKAANPRLADVPIRAFPASLHESGETRVIPLDLAVELGQNTPPRLRIFSLTTFGLMLGNRFRRSPLPVLKFFM